MGGYGRNGYTQDVLRGLGAFWVGMGGWPIAIYPPKPSTCSRFRRFLFTEALLISLAVSGVSLAVSLAVSGVSLAVSLAVL